MITPLNIGRLRGNLGEWYKLPAEHRYAKRVEATAILCYHVAWAGRSVLVAVDTKHSATEPRYFALGQTDEARRLLVVFTIRELFIRVISARDMNKNERKENERAQAEENTATDSKV